MKTRVCLKYFLNDCLWKQIFAANSVQTVPDLISVTVLVTLRPFVQFQFKIGQLTCKQVIKFDFLGTCYFSLFAKFENWY